MDGTPDKAPMKTLGRRRPSGGGLAAAAPFLDLAIRLHEGRPFIPKGVHRFASFEEATAWSMQMMARSQRPDHPALPISSPSAEA